jgi:hypothetical protein
MPKPPDPSSRKRAASPASIASHSTTTDVLSGIGRLEEQLKEIKTQLSEEREARRRMEERLLVAQAEKDAALDTVARLQRAVESMQREMRSNNIVIYGVPESPEDSGTTVKALLSPSSSSLSQNILEVRRLGRGVGAGTNTQSRPRPILVKFSCSSAKHQAFSYSKRLREEKRITMDDDLTPNQRATRDKLRPTFQQLKDQGLRPFWRGDRLMTVTPQGVREHRVAPAPPPAPAPALQRE